MNIYFPIAEISANIYYIIGIGVISGMLSSMFGIGGGFIATPFLISIGVPPYIAISCATHQIVGSSFMGVLTKIKPMKFDVKLASILAFFGVIGSFGGVVLIKYLKGIGYVDILISIAYVVVMTSTAFSILMRFAFKNKKKVARKSLVESMPWHVEFPASGRSISMVFIVLLGLFIGFLTGIMGIGGGFIMVPVMTYVLKLNQEKIIGTSLVQIFIVTLFVTTVNIFYTEFLDIMLGIVLIIGGVVGSFVGNIIAKNMKLEQTNFFLALLILTVAIFFGVTLVKKPSSDQMFTIEAVKQE
jgi:uncharacterized membrane protein YfcA